MEKSDSIKELATALSKAQGEYKGAVKKAVNPAFKKPGEDGSKYANLEADFHCIQEPFTRHGLSITQSVVKGEPYLSTTIMHTSGEWITSYVPFKPAENATAQLIKSFTTYAKRNGLEAAAGIPSTDDDDGNIASGKDKLHQKPYDPKNHFEPLEPLPDFDAYPNEEASQLFPGLEKSTQTKDHIFTIGKGMKGKKFSDQLKDPTFVNWVKSEVEHNLAKCHAEIKDFYEYAKDRGAIK